MTGDDWVTFFPQKSAPIFYAYIEALFSSVGSKEYRNLYLDIGDGRGMRDILEDGNLSCAYFPSSILLPFKLINKKHATVSGMLNDMLFDMWRKGSWERIKEPRVGSVLVWEKMTHASGNTHAHIGFYAAHHTALSHRSEWRTPILHHWTFGVDERVRPIRKVERIYWNKKLDH